jgi:DNA-binding CsgD family transcriptional regulator
VRRRHAEYFLKLAEEVDPELSGQDRLAWSERLRSERANLRSALSWALERKEAELALRLAGSSDFSSFGEWSGLGEWRGRLEEALANGEQAPPTARAMALGGLMWVALWQGDFSRAEAAGEECLALSRQTDDPKGVAFALRLLASVAIADRGDYRRATELYEEGMALCREHGYKGDLAYFLSDIGENCMLQGDYGRAKELHDEAATLLREEMNGKGLELVLESQGWATLLQGDPEQARALFEEGLALCRQVDNKLFTIGYLEGLACIAAARAEDERAARLFGAARTLHETIGYRHSADQRALRKPYLSAARSRLDEQTWEAEFAEGHSMAFEEAVEYAFSGNDPTAPQASDRPVARERQPHLTPREEEVVALVMQGLTNRQIATKLSISKRTAANHVARILKKLGLSSRTQIRALVVEDRP